MLRLGPRLVAAGLVLAATACSSTQPAPASPPAPAPADGRQPIRIRFTGDMLPNDQLLARARRYSGGTGYDFVPMLSGMERFISVADWAVCHQETPVSANNSTVAYYPRFYAPYQLAAAEAAIGYDACSTASNHSVDHGAAGIRSTLQTLERYGIEHTGTARSRAEARRPTIYDVRGAQVGHLSYTYGLNGLERSHPWTVNLIDPEQIRTDARRITRTGAEIVVVSLHWGMPKQSEPSADQQRIADAVLQSPGWRISRVGYIPTFVDAPSARVVLAPPFSYRRTVETLTSMGAPLVDLTPR